MTHDTEPPHAASDGGTLTFLPKRNPNPLPDTVTGLIEKLTRDTPLYDAMAVAVSEAWEKPHIKNLRNRIQQLESLLQQHGIKLPEQERSGDE